MPRKMKEELRTQWSRSIGISNGRTDTGRLSPTMTGSPLRAALERCGVAYGPKTPGWNERKKYDLAQAFERIVAVGYENEFGMPPEVVVDELGIRVRWPDGRLDFCDVE